VFSTQLDPEDLASETCGMKILASYLSTEANYQGFFGVEDA
ncbi:hypothetical protein PC112_g11338, partial [Phytophthora cactorum]